MYCVCLVAKLCLTFWSLWVAAHQTSLSFTISQSLLRFTSIEWVMLSNHLMLCHPLLPLPLFIATECHGQLSSRDRKRASGCLRMYWEKTVIKDVVKLQHSHYATTLEKDLEDSYKVKHAFLIWPSNSQEESNSMFPKNLLHQYFIATFLIITKD